MEERKKRTKLSKEDALTLMQKFCTLQDRCQTEVRTRLIEHRVYGDDLEEILADLPYVPLWYEDHVVVFRDDVIGYDVGLDGNYDALMNVGRREW